mmetsp:Transcript_2859/g.4333  ORF Transcript_2859/g.4333 Transcript_2859/m.4333 type:complete len:240 (+) Transcript_2859:1484-2203(+)
MHFKLPRLDDIGVVQEERAPKLLPPQLHVSQKVPGNHLGVCSTVTYNNSVTSMAQERNEAQVVGVCTVRQVHIGGRVVFAVGDVEGGTPQAHKWEGREVDVPFWGHNRKDAVDEYKHDGHGQDVRRVVLIDCDKEPEEDKGMDQGHGKEEAKCKKVAKAHPTAQPRPKHRHQGQPSAQCVRPHVVAHSSGRDGHTVSNGQTLEEVHGRRVIAVEALAVFGGDGEYIKRPHFPVRRFRLP